MKKSSISGNRDLKVVYLILLLIIVFLVIFSAYVLISQSKIQKAVNENFNNITSGFSEKDKLITANIVSCDSDYSCNNLFKFRRYACLDGLRPVCVDKFCKCGN